MIPSCLAPSSLLMNLLLQPAPHRAARALGPQELGKLVAALQKPAVPRACTSGAELQGSTVLTLRLLHLGLSHLSSASPCPLPFPIITTDDILQGALMSPTQQSSPSPTTPFFSCIPSVPYDVCSFPGWTQATHLMPLYSVKTAQSTYSNKLPPSSWATPSTAFTGANQCFQNVNPIQ